MAQQNLQELFDTFLNQQPNFTQKAALQEGYTPQDLPHREEQINQLASILVPALRGEKPSNVFIYGKTGTGKTLVSKYVAQELQKRAQKTNLSLNTYYFNCKMEKLNTPYRLLAHFLTELGEDIPPTGLPTEEVFKQFFKSLEKQNSVFVVILDEIDAITNTDILYDLTRINTELKNSKITLVGISNDLSFTNDLDPRIKSSLSEEELVFPPYNALQLRDILSQRATLALQEDIIGAAVIPKCAALAAQEHGDARRALDLLRVACEIAERSGLSKISEEHVDLAQKKLDIDRVVEVVRMQPKQSQIVLYSIIYLSDLNKNEIATGEAYEVYKNLCKNVRVKPLTQRRVSDLLSELGMLGMISTSVISKGRYGRTRTIELDINGTALERCRAILQQELT